MYVRTVSTWRLAGAAILLGMSTGACDPGSDPGAPDERVAVGLGVMAVSIAAGPQGGGPLDNFLPCARRGVIDYRNTDAGRQATISGCDLGGGVVADGEGEVRWVGPGLSPTRDAITRAEFVGSLSVTVDGEPRAIESFEVVPERLVPVFEQAIPGRPELASAQVTADGATAVFDNTAIDAFFEPADLTIDSIANPSGALASFTEADRKRLAYHGGMFLLQLAFGEAVESQRGDHSHEQPCGTTDVTYGDEGAARLAARWDACESAGLLYTGEHAWELRAVIEEQDVQELAFELTGPMTLGGGVPRVTIDRMTYALDTRGLPLRLAISAEVQGAEDALSLAFEVFTDD